MKRFAIIAIASLICSASVASVDYRVEKVAVSYHAPVLPSFDVTPIIDFPMINTVVIDPVLTNNFNGLVVFPELGTSALKEGFNSVARGPPKSSSKIV